MPDAHADRIRQIVSEEFGFWVRDQWIDQLKKKVSRRMAYRGVNNFDEYIERLGTGKHVNSELYALVEDLWIHETSFWRYPQQLEALHKTVLPTLSKQDPSRKIRLTSLGCSTGEEPYSMAMAAAELSRKSNLGRFEITGVDSSQESLSQAEAGIYAPFQLRELNDSMRCRWFNEVDNTWEVKHEIRSLVRFFRHNLLEPLPMAGLDVIFCCNVLIYFKKDCSQRILRSFHAALKPGGYLFLGPSESALTFVDLFQSICAHGTIYYKKIACAKPRPQPVPYLQGEKG